MKRTPHARQSWDESTRLTISAEKTGRPIHDPAIITMMAPKKFAEVTPESPGLLREFAGFLREQRKWWLAPILLTLLLIGVLLVLGGSGAAPFIYTLF